MSRRKAEEVKRSERLRKKHELEQVWKPKRQVDKMDTEDEYMVDQLDELIRSLTPVQDLEDNRGAWRTWRKLSLFVGGSVENPLSK